MKYKKKPIIVEAFQWLGIPNDVPNWISGKFHGEGSYLVIYTLEGDMIANKGDWIIKGIKGEVYPCKPDIFKETYEEAI